MQSNKQFEIKGVQLKYVRRRYSNRTFTWLHYKDANDVWQEFGDPWPSIQPKTAELYDAVDKILAMHPLDAS